MSSLRIGSNTSTPPPIHLYQPFVHEVAKQTVADYAPKRDIFNIPHILGIGIGDGHVKVTVTRRHILQDSYLPSEIASIPVLIEERSRPSRDRVSAYRAVKTKSSSSGGGGGGTITGGAQVPSGCACTGVVVDSAGKNYILSAAHCFGNINPTVTFGGKTVATYTRSALKCGDQANHMDASIAALLPGVAFDYNINGLGKPTGLARPAINDTATIQGPFAGKASGKITTISYTSNDTYPEISSNCNVKHVNNFEANLGKIGDSGACTWNQNGKIIGIDYAGDGLEQFSDISFLQSDLGVMFGGITGATAPAATGTTTPSGGATVAPTLGPKKGITSNQIILVGGVLFVVLMVATISQR